MSFFGINFLGLGFVGLAALALLAYLALGRRASTPPVLREVNAFDFLPDTVGEAVESGKRIHMSLGTGTIGNTDTASTLAGLKVLDMIAQVAVVSDKPPIVTTSDGTAMYLAQSTLQSVYARQFAEDRYNPTLARVAGLSPLAFGAALTSTLNDEAVAGNVLIGPSGPEALLLAEAGQRANQPVLATSHDPATQGLLFAVADHTLLGEDIFAGAAYLARQPRDIAGLQTQDLLRIVVGVVIVLGVIAKTLGVLP